jgi:hypothetical protein
VNDLFSAEKKRRRKEVKAMNYTKPEVVRQDRAIDAILGQQPGSKMGTLIFDNSPVNTTYQTAPAYEADE